MEMEKTCCHWVERALVYNGDVNSTNHKEAHTHESGTTLRPVNDGLPRATGSSTSKSRGVARGPNLRRLLGTRSVEGDEEAEGDDKAEQKTMFSTSTDKVPLVVGSEHREINSMSEARFGGGTFLHRGEDLSSKHLKDEES
jgi:hypothetical protein